MEVYAAMIDNVDQNIGRILSSIKKSGEANNTLILFLSDNGSCAESPGGENNIAHVPGPKEYYSHVGPSWAMPKTRLSAATNLECMKAESPLLSLPIGLGSSPKTP